GGATGDSGAQLAFSRHDHVIYKRGGELKGNAHTNIHQATGYLFVVCRGSEWRADDESVADDLLVPLKNFVVDPKLKTYGGVDAAHMDIELVHRRKRAVGFILSRISNSALQLHVFGM